MMRNFDKAVINFGVFPQWERKDQAGCFMNDNIYVDKDGKKYIKKEKTNWMTKQEEISYFEVSPIEWEIIYKKENAYLLWSTRMLKFLCFSKYNNSVYIYSDIRRYLNNEFYRFAFNEKEKESIFKYNLKDKLYEYDKKCEEEYDNVFLLSMDELDRAGKIRIIKKPTQYAYWSDTSMGGAYHSWIARDPYNTSSIQGVAMSHSGYDFRISNFFAGEVTGIAPAIWVKCEYIDKILTHSID